MGCFDSCFREQNENQNNRREKENFNRRMSDKNKKTENSIVYTNISEVESAIKKSEHRKDRIQVYGNYFEYQKPEVQEKIRQEINECQKVYDLYKRNLAKMENKLKAFPSQRAQCKEQVDKNEAVFNECQQALAAFNQLKSERKNVPITPPDKVYAQIGKLYEQKKRFWLAYRDMYPILEEERRRYLSMESSAQKLDFYRDSNDRLLTKEIQKLVDLRQQCSPELQEEVKKLICNIKKIDERIIATKEQFDSCTDHESRWRFFSIDFKIPSCPIEAIQEVSKNLLRKHRMERYVYYSDKLQGQIKKFLKDLKSLGKPFEEGVNKFEKQYNNIKAKIDLLAHEKLSNRNEKLTDEKYLIKSIKSLHSLHETLVNDYPKPKARAEFPADLQPETIHQEIAKCKKVYDSYTSKLEQVRKDLEESLSQWEQCQEQINKNEAVFSESQKVLAAFYQLKSDLKNRRRTSITPAEVYKQVTKAYKQMNRYQSAERGMGLILRKGWDKHGPMKEFAMEHLNDRLLTEEIQKLVDLRQQCSPELQKKSEKLICDIKQLREDIRATTKQLNGHTGSLLELNWRHCDILRDIGYQQNLNLKDSPIMSIKEISKNLPRKDRIKCYAYYSNELNCQIQKFLKDLNSSEHPKAKDFLDQYKEIKGKIRSALEKATKGKYSLFYRGAMFSDACYNKRKTGEEELIKSIRSLEDLVNHWAHLDEPACKDLQRLPERRMDRLQIIKRLQNGSSFQRARHLGYSRPWIRDRVRYLERKKLIQRYYDSGKKHLRARQYKKALRYFKRVIALDRNHARAYAYRGRAYLELKQFKRALADFKRAQHLGHSQSWILDQMRQYLEGMYQK